MLKLLLCTLLFANVHALGRLFQRYFIRGADLGPVNRGGLTFRPEFFFHNRVCSSGELCCKQAWREYYRYRQPRGSDIVPTPAQRKVGYETPYGIGAFPQVPPGYHGDLLRQFYCYDSRSRLDPIIPGFDTPQTRTVSTPFVAECLPPGRWIEYQVWVQQEDEKQVAILTGTKDVACETQIARRGKIARLLGRCLPPLRKIFGKKEDKYVAYQEDAKGNQVNLETQWHFEDVKIGGTVTEHDQTAQAVGFELTEPGEEMHVCVSSRTASFVMLAVAVTIVI